MIERCISCQSTRLVRGIEQKTRYRRETTASLAPGGPLGVGKAIGDVRGVACVDCGAVHWEARDLETPKRLYEEQQAGAIQLK